jgi:hypothetical protein
MEPSHWLLQNRKEHTLSKRLAQHFAALLQVPLLKTRLIPTSLSNPFLPLEEQPFSGCEEIVLSNKEPLHGKNILILTTTLKTGTTWKACSQSLELHGLSRIWNMGLIASEFSWMNT